MDLKKLNVVALNAQQVKETEGGFGIVSALIAVAAYLLVESGTNPNSSVAAYNKGYNSQGWK